ncbi:MAG: hypothetical protein PHH59_12235 [Methylovulum sp.]|uniref:hypothetical protein n=1 Tax=Methylovulum sp. TaxID=1916980 RepID=UPI002625B744|nr:hypothetical protein [Methylovulum sp.]MDD2724777.1 hypothetical protein [Methylovulum sp.]MDD5126001.1 hypothetical protein [Methylovulum sp.]
MTPILRISLVTFLVLLQFVSPLVHAHAGHPVFAAMAGKAGKLHIPGLEALGMVGDHLQANKATGSIQAMDMPSDGLIVGVHSGIKQAQHDMLPDTGDFFHLPPLLSVAIPFFTEFQVGFSSRNIAFSYRLTLTAHAPRAPPSSTFFA